MVPRLIIEPKHYDPAYSGGGYARMSAKSMSSENDGPTFANADRRDLGVFRPGKPFVEDGLRIMSAPV